MTTRTFLRRTALAGVGVAAALSLAACGSDDHGSTSGMGHGMSSSPSTATTGGSAAAGNGADVMFAQMMIPHHQQAVQMAELADTRAADPEVRQLAGQIKAAQAPEIATMSGWLTAWGKPAPMASASGGMPGMTGGSGMPEMDHGMPGMVSAADMDKLEAASGKDFDKHFLTMMIAHHQGAITMAEDEVTRGANTDAKALAQRIITAQQAEIATMNKILARL
ncbi:DUF305 domain-containing protein [Micromonospora sp. DT47]|uniref:DUF305 domain-containing protein n=1 Tax=Micromonospora sp. DT47 TaxID=3393431 RepID=UPI003CF87C23